MPITIVTVAKDAGFFLKSDVQLKAQNKWFTIHSLGETRKKIVSSM